MALFGFFWLQSFIKLMTKKVFEKSKMKMIIKKKKKKKKKIILIRVVA